MYPSSNTSPELNNNGDLVIVFDAFGVKDAEITVPVSEVERFVKTSMGSFFEPQCSISEGFTINYINGGNDGRGTFVLFNVSHESGHEFTAEFHSEYIKYKYDQWEKEHSNNMNDLGVAVSRVEYFENGKGFEDTPRVTNMYEENGYAVFEFDAFDRVGNKLYLAIGSDGEGYVELADGGPEVVMSIIQKQADELIINVGYHLPGTQLYITLVPAE